MTTVLAGDIGGTNTRLALIDADNLLEPQLMRVYRSGDYESLLSIVDAFYAECHDTIERHRPTRAGFGIAGPVESAVIKLTNLPWEVDAHRLRDRLDVAHVRFVNDFAAQCHAVAHLRTEDVHRLGGDDPRPDAPIAVLGAGTGLGQGFLFHTGRRYRVVPSEGGHADFAPRNALEMRLLSFLLQRHDRVSSERVLSGKGLIALYEFFRDSEGMAEDPAVREQMRREDPAVVVSRNAMAHADPVCERALDLFCTLYGAEAGNLALKVLARGGVYVTGGIAQHIIERLESGGFRFAFEAKGRYSDFLRGLPVFVITHPQPGLVGAAAAALEE